MEDKIELLKKLGFSENYLKYINCMSNHDDSCTVSIDHFVFDVISVDSSEIIYPVIDKTEEPINSYINNSSI